MGRLLKNPRHEKFVRTYLTEMANGGTAKAAYEKVYPGPFKKDVSKACAHNLLQKPKVKRRIREMRMDIKRRADISFEKILTDYQDAMERARAKDDPGNIIAAAREQAKLVGLLIDRKEVGSAGDFERMESISDILQAVSEMAGSEAALALSQAFNVMGPTLITREEIRPDKESEAILLKSDPESDAIN